MCRGTTNFEDVYLIKKELIPRETLKQLNQKWIDGHGGIPVDECIGRETQELIVNGIVTVGTCCGHGKWQSSALALPTEKEKLENLGYSTRLFENGLIEIDLKTGTQLN